LAKGKDGAELMTALEETFLAEGYREVTLRDLAKRLGCSYRRLYDMAPNKEALFLMVMTAFFARLKKEGWRAANADRPLANRMENYLRVGVDYAKRMSVACQEDLDATPAGRIVFDSLQEERVGGLKEMLDEGASTGEFGGFHSLLVAEMMIVAVKHIREPVFLAKAGLTLSEALEEHSRLFRAGLMSK
jgi:AcrR family transcriptional regulator